jgi:regulator of replication initiation timing
VQSDFNKVKFELEKYKGENAILKKQNEALQAYLQDSQVQLNKENEKVSEKAKFIDSPEEADSDSSSSSTNEGSGN